MSIESGLLISVIVGLLLGNNNISTNYVPEGYELVFSDEFEGYSINKEKWALGNNPNNIQNLNHDCAFTWDNISLRDGNLVFTQQKEDIPVVGRSYESEDGFKLFDYTSGALHIPTNILTLKNNMYVEIRLKLPDNDAGFPAFWTYPSISTRTDRDLEDLLEIDMFEFVASREKSLFWSGLWWHDFRKNEISEYVDSENVYELAEDHFRVSDYHHMATIGINSPDSPSNLNYYNYLTFGFKVSEDTMEWYISQKGSPLRRAPYLVFKGGEVHSYAFWDGIAPTDIWYRNVPKNLDGRIILTYSLNNNLWAGGPVKDHQLPSEMIIDYIRIYQIK